MKKKILLLCLLLASFYSLGYNSESMINLESNYREIKTNSGGPSFSNVSIISDGYGGDYWNDGSSQDSSMVVDGDGNLHVVWEDDTDGPWGTDREIMYTKYSIDFGWIYPIVISDGYGGSYWNDEDSINPVIGVTDSGEVHVAWYDNTDGVWGTDIEIMHVKYSPGVGWSNATVISDGYGGSYWNDGLSYYPSIGVTDSGEVHVAWYDSTHGVWGTDIEIMHVKYSPGVGWSNATVISDGYGGSYWNDGSSYNPSIGVTDSGEVHVAWHDYTDGVWGTDIEIMHGKYSPGVGWSNATVISDGYGGSYWNDGSSYYPSIDITDTGEVHVVWKDTTHGVWGTDSEIMYSKFSSDLGWCYPIVVSDGFEGSYWNDGISSSPVITVEKKGNVYICWDDATNGPWGTDTEIMVVSIESDISKALPETFSLSSDAEIPDTDGIFNLQWTESEYATEYSIFMVYNATTTQYATGLQDRTFSVYNLEIGQYQFYITAYNENGAISSNAISITVNNSAESMQSPSTFTLSTDALDPDSDGSFYLQWTKADRATEYMIIVETYGTTSQLATGLVERTFLVFGLITGNYTIHIVALNEYGETNSNEINVNVANEVLNDSEFTNFLKDYGALSGVGIVAILVVVMGLSKKKL